MMTAKLVGTNLHNTEMVGTVKSMCWADFKNDETMPPHPAEELRALGCSVLLYLKLMNMLKQEMSYNFPKVFPRFPRIYPKTYENYAASLRVMSIYRGSTDTD
ncbi:unnamed protein product [Soboliphyme baturini]|uniref:Myosin motor domain-containing protein n=1 Tax=Soboliphyme baturini TaxID=241478 RepID=A0A183ILB3_9BILA|nr:unnamed protein product [Soboliphyme baturini]